MYLRAFRTYKSVVMYSYISEHSELTSQWLCTHVSQSSQNLQVSSYVLMYLRAVRTYKSVVMYSCISYDRTTSVTKLLRQLNLEPLDKRRRIYRLTFLLYKVLNEHVAVPPDKLDIKQNGRPVRGSVTKQRLVIPRCSTNELKNSFVPRTIVQWNALPDSTTSAASVNAFRSHLYKSCP